ncbi:MAG: hypothetical protein LBN06_09445 [Prevotellaceae bacterium]|jgi:hypothetical protein|nr:hypothetical protein [Prevotellaceae bacterium]
MNVKMKTMCWTLFMSAAIALGSMMTACSSSNDTPAPPITGGGDGNEDKDPEVSYVGSVAYSDGILFNKKTELGNGSQEFVFGGNVELGKGTYLLKGWVYVAKGAKLVIPAGTVIKGDKQTQAALIIEPGGYVEMRGTKEAPIVMTSEEAPGNRRPGDWGGLIICGYAKNNQGEQQIEGGPRTKHGGDDDNDNSGIFQYIRVEFAGYPFATDKEINGITFGSVGKATIIDHLQVSYSNDDSYEWFGGTADASYLVAYKGWDDDFDTDNGFSGTVQYCLAIRDPRIADTSQSNSFESDNNATGADTAPFTHATFKNVTLIGPAVAKNSDFVNSSEYINAGSVYPDNGSKLGKFQAAIQIRRSSKLNIENMLAAGYPIGLIVDGEKGNSVQYARDGEFKLRNIFFAGMSALGSDNNKKYEDELYDPETKSYDATQFSYSHTFFLSQAGNKVMNEADLNLTDPAKTGQNYCPAAIISDGNGGYIGAFKESSDNWLEGWTNFDPQNTVY